MMRIRTHGENTNTTCLMRSTEGAGERRTAGCKTSPRCETRTEAWRTGNVGRRAGRAGKLSNRQGAVVLDKLFSASLQNDSIVENAVAAAKNSLALAERIIGESHTRTKVFFVRNFL